MDIYMPYIDIHASEMVLIFLIVSVAAVLITRMLTRRAA